ncbi:DNA-invertase hin (plasmid) [Paracoccus marcusii]|nr:DNA-invertase hin [Paracoccus marcusii]
MILGYARVSTMDQNLDSQRDALTAAGAERIFADTISGTELAPVSTGHLGIAMEA